MNCIEWGSCHCGQFHINGVKTPGKKEVSNPFQLSQESFDHSKDILVLYDTHTNKKLYFKNMRRAADFTGSNCTRMLTGINNRDKIYKRRWYIDIIKGD